MNTLLNLNDHQCQGFFAMKKVFSTDCESAKGLLNSESCTNKAAAYTESVLQTRNKFL